jgi:hypothetical protein
MIPKKKKKDRNSTLRPLRTYGESFYASFWVSLNAKQGSVSNIQTNLNVQGDKHEKINLHPIRFSNSKP